jgi:recombination protein RecT
MSNLQRAENLKQIVQLVQPQFEELAKIHHAVDYKREASFALQIISDNDYLAGIAMSNQDSFKRAIINVAAVGLTLSPVYKLAYLVPRKNKVCLDISYLGYIQLAIECGAIKWAVADIVCKKDKFRIGALGTAPLHEYEVFEDRGEIIGAYCVVKTQDNEFLTTIMPIKDIYKIRDRSESYKSGKGGPWNTDESEMIKKTVVRRAYKSWPKSNTGANRLEKATEVLNESDPIDVTALPAVSETSAELKLVEIREKLVFLERTEEKYISHLSKVNKREIKSLNDLTEIEIDQALVMLDQLVEQKNMKLKKAVGE